MWNRIKRAYSFVFRIILAISFMSFTIILLSALLNKGIAQNQTIITYLALLGLLFSLPATANSLVEEFNPKKKKYKVSCTCPNCKQQVMMEMSEE